ncbi:hypothetical protein HG536_0B06390 [Torulaspora globosa]|uniref:Uncharacterized protein n=1 Tax=Torulaspora globosa TaxID=48254 RepID=A0A7G3ZE35_9SACH|nr:uncharacterized protein HG536_0B06390 [Torulaspora globosa]QLL31771.1 hypothetical protein HG536_0B06390 [Torulaspora globosa]
MSDAGRKDFSEKLSEKAKPESQKSYMEQGKEKVTDAADRVAGAIQPEENKGVAQGVHDAAKEGKDEAKGESFEETAGQYVEAAKKKLEEAVEYVSSSVHGGEPSKK